MLSADELVVSYDSASKVAELDGVSIQFAAGSITAIVGPNGSGKSTLIRSLSRVLPPFGGTVLLSGSDLYREVTARQAARSIAVVPQDTHVAFDFTAREIVAMGRTPHLSRWEIFAGETAVDRAAVEEALARAEIGAEIASRPVMTLSGGERQRVLIARALVQGAATILLDEPTASLDLAHQTHLFHRLRVLADTDNKAVVVVLHDLNQAAACADRLVVLNHGSLAASGPVEEVLTRELVRDVYGCDVRLCNDPVNGKVMVAALPVSAGEQKLHGRRFHVICGGGGGAEILRLLASAGADLSAGYLHFGDTDQTVADALNVPYRQIGAFDLVPELTETEVKTIVEKNAAVIFAPASIGEVNLASLKAAVALANAGAAVYTLSKTAETPSTTATAEQYPRAALWAKLRARLRIAPISSPSRIAALFEGAMDA